MIAYDIGLPDGNDDYIPIFTDHLARGIMHSLPREHRDSLIRAINNASEVISNANDDGVKLQVLRGNGENGLTVSLSLSFMEPEEEDYERKMILQGLVTTPKMRATSELIRLEDMPASLSSKLIPGLAISEIIDARVLEGLSVERHTTASNNSTTSIEIILSDTPREEIDEVIWKWKKTSG